MGEGADVGGVPGVEHRREAVDGLVPNLGQSLAAGVGQAEPGCSSIGRINAPLDQPGLLERDERTGDY